MTLAEEMAREALAEERAKLQKLHDTTETVAPWTTREKEIEECNERISSIESKLNDPGLLEDWWASIPADVRTQLFNA